MTFYNKFLHLPISLNHQQRNLSHCQSLFLCYLSVRLGSASTMPVILSFLHINEHSFINKKNNTFSSLTMSLHLSIMSDTAFYNCADGALRSFYFSIFWVIYGLWTNSSTCYYVNYCRLIMVACLFIVYLTVNVNFSCASL